MGGRGRGGCGAALRQRAEGGQGTGGLTRRARPAPAGLAAGPSRAASRTSTCLPPSGRLSCRCRRARRLQQHKGGRGAGGGGGGPLEPGEGQTGAGEGCDRHRCMQLTNDVEQPLDAYPACAPSKQHPRRCPPVSHFAVAVVPATTTVHFCAAPQVVVAQGSGRHAPPAHTLPAAQGRVALQARAEPRVPVPVLVVLLVVLPVVLVVLAVLGRHLKQPSAASRPQTWAPSQVNTHN